MKALTKNSFNVQVQPQTNLEDVAGKILKNNMAMIAHNNGVNMADNIFRVIRAEFAYKIPSNYLAIGMRIIKQDYRHAYNSMTKDQKIVFEKAFRAELKGVIEATIKRDKLEGNS